MRSEGKASVGKGGVAIGLGNGSYAKGEIGALIIICEYDDNGEIDTYKCGIVDGETIKADTYYKLEDGKFKEVVEA